MLEGRGIRACKPGKRPPGHPARGRFSLVEAGLLARGSLLSSGLPKPSGSVTQNGRKLAAHSCGGSPGMARSRRTGFPLSPGPNRPREPRHLYLDGDSHHERNGWRRMDGGTPSDSSLPVSFCCVQQRNTEMHSKWRLRWGLCRFTRRGMCRAPRPSSRSFRRFAIGSWTGPIHHAIR